MLGVWAYYSRRKRPAVWSTLATQRQDQLSALGWRWAKNSLFGVLPSKSELAFPVPHVSQVYSYVGKEKLYWSFSKIGYFGLSILAQQIRS